MLTNETISDWSKRYIDLFRQRWSRSRRSRLVVGNLDDMREPTQVVVACAVAASGPSFSILIGMHRASRPDKEIDVIGPCLPGELAAQAAKLLEADRWQEQLKADRFLLEVGGTTYGRVVAHEIARSLDTFDRLVLGSAYSAAEAPPHVGGKQIVPPDGFTWELYGDFTALNPADLIQQSTTRVARRKRGGQGPTQTAKPPRREAQGALIHPPVWIGTRPVRSIEDVLSRRSGGMWRPKDPVLTSRYGKNEVEVYQNGMVLVFTDDPSEALGALNTVMATAWLLGLTPATAIRTLDLWRISIDEANPDNFSTMSEQTPRNEAMSPFGERRPEWVPLDVVTAAEFRELLRVAYQIAGDDDLSFELRFAHEAHTSYTEGDYRRAFLDSWIVVEHWIFRLWQQQLVTKGRSRREIESLARDRNWTAAVVSETLELTGAIEQRELRQVTGWRRLRNQLVHEGAAVDRDDADQILDFVTLLIRTHANEELGVVVDQPKHDDV